MKNYFKKFSIIFVMLLAVIGFGMIQNGITANATTVGQYQRGTQYLKELSGYNRYDDSDKNISYSVNFVDANTIEDCSTLYKKNRKDLVRPGKEGTIKFSFYGTSIALLDYICNNRIQNCTISFDGGNTSEVFSAYGTASVPQVSPTKYITAFYVKNGLENKRHDVIINIPASDNSWFCLDVIDTDGHLVPYGEDNKTTEPEEPSDKSGALLIINLTDGETKVYDVSSSEIDKFKSWYNTKTEYENKLTYEFDKTVNSNIKVEENVVHEKITSFEIRKY